MLFADTPAVENYPVPRHEGRVGAGRDHASEVDPGHQREGSHDRALAGNREAVLVVQRAELDVDGHLTVGQAAVRQFGDVGAISPLVLLDQHGFEQLELLFTIFLWDLAFDSSGRGRPATKPAMKVSSGRPFLTRRARITAPSQPIQKNSAKASQSALVWPCAAT